MPEFDKKLIAFLNERFSAISSIQEERFSSLTALQNERFNTLTTLQNAYNKNIEDKLDSINTTLNNYKEEQNKRLTQLENDFYEFKEYANKVIDTREITCNVKKDFDNYKEEHKDMDFFIRHPKLAISILVFCVLFTIGTFISSKPFIKGKELYNNEKVIKQMPTDSLKK